MVPRWNCNWQHFRIFNCRFKHIKYTNFSNHEYNKTPGDIIINIINNNLYINLIEEQEIFWNITELLQSKINTLEYYSKNKLSSMPQETNLYVYN